ncbi:MAG: hypothetical protein K6B75_01265 [Lachnospiraceae bacterium]|nr:hypothetical protein [Lachnospiraceae bacterium]
MITFVCALYEEAKPIIEKFNLKRANDALYDTYTSSDVSGPVLLITGVGKTAAACAVSAHFALHPSGPSDILVNIGCAGICPGSKDNPFGDFTPESGELFLSCKLEDVSAERTYYPDRLYASDFKYAYVKTYDKVLKSIVITNSATPLPILADMEASGIYTAALKFFTPDRLFFFKYAYDTPGEENTCLPALSTLTGSKLEEICSFCNDVTAFLTDFNRKPLISEVQKDLEKDFLSRTHATKTMEDRFKTAINYRMLQGLDCTGLLKNFLNSEENKGLKTKRDSLAAFERFIQEAIVNEDKAGSINGLEASYSHENSRTDKCPLLPPLSTIYVEEDLLTKEVFEKYQKAGKLVIPIKHYKDVFNRSRQNPALQKLSQSLILARQSGKFVFPGARVCQSFGNSHFYYTSLVMNCIYHCDYCYLQGMYPSGNIVVFENLKDAFKEIKELLNEHPVYACISFDTDLLAMEGMLGFVKRFVAFAKNEPDLLIEIRTKSGNKTVFKDLSEGLTPEEKKRIIFAWTLSPDKIYEKYEKRTAAPKARISALKEAAACGFNVRLCLDPVIHIPGWKKLYTGFCNEIFKEIEPASLLDLSLGVFRISTDSLKLLKKRRPDSAPVHFPYISEKGVSHYGSLSSEMIESIKDKLKEYIPEEKIFTWEGENNG